jgi:hypothetical protein
LARVSKILKMQNRQSRRNENVASPPQAILPKPVFALPVDASEEQSGSAKIHKWLELADIALAIPERRKTA